MSDTGPTEGEEWYGNEVLDIIDLESDGWKIYRVDGDISEDDFIVKVINPSHPRGVKIKHAHFAYDSTDSAGLSQSQAGKCRYCI